MLQLQIENCSQDNAEVIADFLENLGAVSVTMIDQYDDPILEPELGTMPLWPHVVVKALYELNSEIELIKHALLTNYPDIKYAIETLPEQDWEKTCLVDFKPQKFGEKLLVCPSWVTPPSEDTVNLTLDPGLAFGTGTHSTTSLCLTWLEKITLTQKTLIDFGCGSGILGLAALKLGGKHVFAVDIDEQALIATENNAAANNIDKTQISISKPDELFEKVDILIANILLKTLIKLKSNFIKLIKENGLLVVSGILACQTDELIEEYKSDFNLSSIEFHDDWAMLVFEFMPK
jgi:ribosomal protein L11 methyltransferase